MCLTIPGKIIDIKKDRVTVDYDIEKRKALLLEKKYKIGDYVIIQGGFVVQKVPRKQAIESLTLYKKTPP